MQADLWRKAGQPEKGFSVALRAASVSFRARLGPSLWTAVGLLGNILNSLGEWDNARRLIEGVLPQVRFSHSHTINIVLTWVHQALEGADHMLSGTLYSHLADSHMGLASPSPPPSPVETTASPSRSTSSPVSSSSRMRAANIAKAELYIDRARECYKKTGYLDGECEQLMKKAIIAKLRGDEKLAEEWAQNHNRVWEEGMKRIEGET